MANAQSTRMTGTALNPKPVAKSAGSRYCYACDKFMSARVCKACGLDTEKAGA